MRPLYPMRTSFLTFTMIVFFVLCPPLSRGETKGKEVASRGIRVPILVYHRFGPVAADRMTVSTSIFESQLKYLKDNSYTVIPLRYVVEYHLGKRQTLPSRSIAITVDDGHKTVYTDMIPLLTRYSLPVTLHIYPSAISHASYAMTWDQLRELKKTGLVDVQSHTFWHPDCRKDKKRLTSVEYESFLKKQFKKSKEVLQKELDTKVDMLAWPFGIYDDELITKAVEAGYVAGFTIERHHVDTSDNVMVLPRYLITDGDREKAFGRILAGPNQGG